jgi:hypothetical protein
MQQTNKQASNSIIFPREETQFQIKMATSTFSPEEQAKELMVFLQSSNLHYAAQVTPFSLYITVRKKFRKYSNVVVSDQTSSQLPQINLPIEPLESLQKDHENVLKQKARDFDELKVAKELVEEKLERLEAFKLDLETELDQKSLECHELKVTNNMLRDKLQKAGIEFTSVQENKDMLKEKVEFLAACVKRATEETLNMERKLTESKKVIKKNKKLHQTL